MSENCVCGGSTANPNRDCERCQLKAQLAAAEQAQRRAEGECERLRANIPDAVNCLFISPGGQEAVRLMLLDKVQYELWRWSVDEAIEIVSNYLLAPRDAAEQPKPEEPTDAQ